MGALDLTWVDSKSYCGWKKYHAGKVHYLGRDRPAAEVVWLKMLLAERQAPEAIRGVTIASAVDEFCQHVDSHDGHTLAWRQALTWRIRRARKHVGNIPLSMLDFARLSEWVTSMLHVPRAPKTVSNMVQAVRQFIQWLDDAGRISCPKWHRAFRLRGRLSASPPPSILTLGQFATLYHHARPIMRTWMMVALNTGSTQSELATLTCGHVHGDRIIRNRHKTGIMGNWTLWTGTLEALAQHREPDGELLFRTRTGKPLVHYSTASKTDAVGLAWQRLQRLTGVRGYGFKSIRKLGAQFVREHSGTETASQYLAHAPATVAERHYTRPVQSVLDTALRAMGEAIGIALG